MKNGYQTKQGKNDRTRKKQWRFTRGSLIIFKKFVKKLLKQIKEVDNFCVE